MKRYYLDANAHAPLLPEAAEAYVVALRAAVGNPSSTHTEGRAARAILDQARDSVAALLGARSGEIIFTSGGTESCNLGVLGLALAAPASRRHLICSAVEHHAVLHACEHLRQHHGFSISILPVDNCGRCSLDALKSLAGEQTALVSVMSANNEVGTRQPVAEIGELCRSRGILFHTDAVQCVGREPVLVHNLACDALSASGHKFGSVPGTGFLWLKSGVALAPVTVGGAQENQRRAGTENAAAAASLATALELSLNQHQAPDRARMHDQIENLWQRVAQSVPSVIRNGHPEQRLDNTLSICVPGASSEDVMIAADLEGLSLSSGSACMVGSALPSHVLLAMGLGRELASCAIRFSLSRELEEDEVSEVVARFARVITRVKG